MLYPPETPRNQQAPLPEELRYSPLPCARFPSARLPSALETFRAQTEEMYARAAGVPTAQLRAELKEAQPILASLLAVPFVGDRNEVTFDRFPKAWLEQLARYPGLSQVPPLRNFLEYFKNAGWCSERSFDCGETTITMCQLRPGLQGAYLKYHLELRGQVEDFCFCLGMFPTRPHLVRPSLIWEPGDEFSLPHLSRGESLLLRDRWSNTLRLELEQEGGNFRLTELTGNSTPPYAPLMSGPIKIIAAQNTTPGGEYRSAGIRGPGIKIQAPVDGALMSLRHAATDAWLHPSNLLLAPVQYGEIAHRQIVHLTPTRVDILSTNYEEQVLWRALRKREKAASLALSSQQARGTGSSSSGVTATPPFPHTLGTSEVLGFKHNGLVNVSIIAGPSGQGTYWRRGEHEIEVGECVGNGRSWTASNSTSTDYQSWVAWLELLAQPRTITRPRTLSAATG